MSAGFIGPGRAARGVAAAFVLVLPLALSVAPAFAQPAPTMQEGQDLFGLWKTPGGNLVHIDRDAQGDLRGRLALVSPDSRAAGFRIGEPVLTGFSGTPAMLAFRLAARAPGAATEAGACPPPDWLPFKGALTPERQRIEGVVRTPEFDLVAGDGQRCRRIGDRDVEVPPYARHTLPGPDTLPERQVMVAERHGPEAVRFEANVDFPEGVAGRADAPRLRVRTLDGEPVAHAEAHWRLTPEDPTAGLEPREYVTETGADGIATLRWTLLPNGRYAPTNQLRQPRAPLT